MSYAKIANGAVEAYPYSFGQLRQAHPNVSFPADVSDAFLAEWGVQRVASVAKPADTVTTTYKQGVPVLVGGVWTEVWVGSPATPAEILIVELALEGLAAKQDAWVTAFLAMTPEQADTYVQNNAATLAALRTIVGRLAYSVRVLIKREFNR